MSEKLLERCTICCGDVYYTAADAFVTCPACGNTQAVAAFQREKNKLQETLRQGKRAQEALADAQQEKQVAQERLNKAVTALGSMDARLYDISAQLGEDREAFEQLLSGLQGGQNALLQTLRGADGVEKKLQNLQDKVQFLLDMGLGDEQQLKSICGAAEKLLAGQSRFDAQLNKLQTAANETQKKLDAFQAAWKQDKLDKVEALFRQAENDRSDRKFGKAEEKYELLQLEGSKYARDPEIFWRMLLSHYGVEYQYSDAAEGYVPTIYYPDLTDPAQMSLRKELFACCDREQTAHYRRALFGIDKVLDEYRRLRTETHYDVFLSVKQADNYGHYTADSDKASTLYDQLTGWGLKVFNSRRVSLPAGQAFEPYIIAALMSAKVMIVVGTRTEYMNAEWVRNEWTRFQWLQKDENKRGKTERVLFCYLANGMQPHQLPSGLNPNMQAIMEDSSAGERLQKTLKSVFPQTFTAHAAEKKSETPADDPLKLMRIWLMLGQYQLVQDKYNELVMKGQYLDNIYTHLNALCAAHQAADMEALIESELDLSREKLFMIAMNVNRAELPRLQEMLQRNRLWRQEAAQQRAAETERVRKAEEEKLRLAEEMRRQQAEAQQKQREVQKLTNLLAQLAVRRKEAAKSPNPPQPAPAVQQTEKPLEVRGLEAKLRWQETMWKRTTQDDERTWQLRREFISNIVKARKQREQLSDAEALHIEIGMMEAEMQRASAQPQSQMAASARQAENAQEVRRLQMQLERQESVWKRVTFESENERLRKRDIIRNTVKMRKQQEKLSDAQALQLEIDMMEAEMRQQSQQYVQRMPAQTQSQMAAPARQAENAQEVRRLQMHLEQQEKLWKRVTFESENERLRARDIIRNTVKMRKQQEKLSDAQALQLEIDMMEAKMQQQTKAFVQRIPAQAAPQPAAPARQPENAQEVRRLQMQLEQQEKLWKRVTFKSENDRLRKRDIIRNTVKMRKQQEKLSDAQALQLEIDMMEAEMQQQTKMFVNRMPR